MHWTRAIVLGVLAVLVYLLGTPAALASCCGSDKPLVSEIPLDAPGVTSPHACAASDYAERNAGDENQNTETCDRCACCISAAPVSTPLPLLPVERTQGQSRQLTAAVAEPWAAAFGFSEAAKPTAFLYQSSGSTRPVYLVNRVFRI